MEQSAKYSGLVSAFDCILGELSWYAEKISTYEAQVSSMGGLFFMANDFFDSLCFNMYINRGIREVCAGSTPNIVA